MTNSLKHIQLAGLRIVILTGQSDPHRPTLSAKQHALLDSIDLPETCKVREAFPFDSANAANRAVEHAVPLWLASVRNLRQFALASTPLFRRAIGGRWQQFAESTDSIVVITGSCGLQFLNALRSVTPVPIRHVFALGPVAWKRPVGPHTLIQGTRDHWSRMFFRRVDERIPGIGHMDYYEHPRISQLINEYLCISISN